MPFDGSGNFNRNFPPGGWQGDASANIKIKADRHDQHDADLASGLSLALCKDGQSSPTADINWGAHKIVNMANPVSPQDAATKAYVDAIRIFSTGIILSGAGNNTRLEYPQADMSFFVRSPGDPTVTDTTARFVWNDKADGTGNNMMVLHDNGEFDLLWKDDGAQPGPTVKLMRESASPAAADYLGHIDWRGKNSADEETAYGRMYAYLEDPVNASEDGGVGIMGMTAGSLVDRAYFGSTAATIYQPLTVNGFLKGTGLLNRAGLGGAYGASQANFMWNGGTGKLEAWIDVTNLGGITTTSDYRIKENVLPLSSMWDKVKSLRPVAYTIADYGELSKASGDEQWGFIAHEVQEDLLATASSGVKDAPNELQGLNLAAIVSALTKALQEAMARIEVLEAKP